MNVFGLLGLLGVAFCINKVYYAWQGMEGIPFGIIFGGALGGMGGAMVGNVLAGDSGEKQKAPPNIGGLFFWGICSLIWVIITIALVFPN
jgi:hypothetical protein